MKNIITFLLLSLVIVAANAQGSDTTSIGKVVYYEGKVELGAGNVWMRAKINTQVKRNQSIKTSSDATAEIVWNNGIKSIVGPNSEQQVQKLFAASSNSPKKDTEGVFSNVKAKMATEVKHKEVGGIRRSEVDTIEKPEETDVYWKEDKEIVFEDAYSFYDKKEYNRAIAALQAFIHQKPLDPMVKYAWFALGHSYIMENNPIKAKEIFDKFVVQYPSDPLKAEADKVLQKL